MRVHDVDDRRRDSELGRRRRSGRVVPVAGAAVVLAPAVKPTKSHVTLASRGTTTLVETLLASASEIYDKLWRIVLPRPFTPSSQVFYWRDDSTKIPELWTHAKRSRWRSDDDEGSCETDSCSDSASDDHHEGLDDGVHPDAMAMETRASRVAAYCPEERLLVLDKYLCKCGKCIQYETIEADVARRVTWRTPDERASVARLLQAFSTFNEAIGYDPEMISTAEECLNTWSGDEDRAFTSFVVLQDIVPFLCANQV